MCTTVQFFFSCGHQATHRFRNATCPTEYSKTCRVRDKNQWLKFMCRRCILRCQQQGVKVYVPTDADHKQYEDIWHIPSRCFVDVGFRNLDPFQDTSSPPVSPTSPATTLASPRSEKPPPTMRIFRDDRGKCARLMAKVMRFNKVNQCCEDRGRKGAFPAVRVEGIENRHEGRMMEDRCSALE
jgi:hypothetical protein